MVLLKTYRKYLLIAAVAVLCSMFMVMDEVNAADKPIRPTDVTTASSGNEMVLLEGTFNYLAKAEILARINEIRKEACYEGVWDPRNSSRRLTSSDYVPLKWSSDLEWIAQIRAAEAVVHWDHHRPKDNEAEEPTTFSRNGVSRWYEDIAWNPTADIIGGINQWYGEKEDWVNKTSGKVTGHYTSMIDPRCLYVGIGAFDPVTGYGAIAGELNKQSGLNESQSAAIGECFQTIEVKKSKMTITPDSPQSVRKGDTVALSLKAQTSYDNDLGGSWSPAITDVILTGTATWKSGNTSIATVDSKGVVTGVAPGDVKITATYGGKNYTFDVTVTKPLEAISLDETAICIHNNEKQTLKIIPDPIDTADSLEAEWTSKDPSVAKVNDQGVVTAVGPGKTKITATIEDLSASCEVTVSTYDFVSVENGLATVKCPNCGKTTTARVPTDFWVFWNKESETSSSTQIPAGMEAGAVVYYNTRYLSYSATADLTLADFEATASDPENCLIDTDEQKVTFLKAGKYTITIYPKYNPEAKKTYDVTIVKELESVELTAEQTGSDPGSTVTLKATPEGGKGTIKYTFYRIEKDGTETVIRESGNSSSCWQSLSEPGDYTFRVDAVDTGDNDHKVSSNKVKAHIHDYQWVKTEDGIATLRCPGCGAEKTGRVPTSFYVYWRDASESGGHYYSSVPSGLEVEDAAGYMFSGVEYSDGSGNTLSGFTVTATEPDGCTIDPSTRKITFHKAGLHEITFSPKYNPELKKVYTIKVVKALEAVALTADPENQQTYGGKVQLKAVPDGGKGRLTYQFVCVDADGQETVIQETDTNDSCEWTPAKAGPYALRVDVTDAGDGNRKVSGSLNYTIAKADHPPVLPAESINVANSVKELSNDILAETPGWEFAETDLGKELVAGETAEFTATYKGEDAGNYETLTAIVKVFRSTCDHAKWEMRNEKAPTCKEPGWSGDKYCLLCEQVFEAGHEIPVTEDHVAGKSVIENNVDPGCETQGSYDVVVYCDVCSKELTRETVTVPATGHAWDEGEITAYPTADADGVRTFTCGNCGQVRTEPIPKDVDEITPSEEMAENAPVDDSIPVVSTSKIKTVSNLKKKQMSVKFPSNAAVDNYRIQYRLAGKATWKNAWSAGTDSYIIKGLKRYSLCEFRIAGFMKQPDGTWARGNWSKVAYRYANAVALKSAKAGKKSITMTWAKDAKATGYQVQYSLKSNMKGATTITVKGKAKTKYTIKGLKSGKKYYVKVRPIKKSGKTYIGSLSKAKAVKVK